jgi:hypothetical protein
MPEGKRLRPLEEVKIHEALLGCFLEYLACEGGVTIKLVEIEGGWAEVDRIEDHKRVVERISAFDARRLNLP